MTNEEIHDTFDDVIEALAQLRSVRRTNKDRVGVELVNELIDRVKQLRVNFDEETTKVK